MAAKNKTAMSPEEKYKLITRNLQMAFNGAVFEAQINASLGLDVGHLPKKRSYPREHSANETLGPAERGKSCQSGNGLKRLFLHLWVCLLCISSCSASPVLDRRADDLCVYAVIYDSEMFSYMKIVIYMPMLVSHDIHCEARKGRIVFELKSLSREDSWFEPVYARNTKLSHHLVLLEQATSGATRWYSDIENGHYEEDGNIFCVDVPTKPCNCVYNICENKHLMRPASSFGTRSDALTLKEFTHGLQQTDKVKHKGGVALWVLKIIHNGVRAIKVKYKEILTNSEVSLQCSGLCEIWNIIGTNSNDFHTDTDNKWIIHMVISFMTLFMTEKKFSGVLPTSSSGKLSRGFVILFLTVCIFETSSATGHNAFKSLALKSEREGQGPIKRLVQIKISENADVDLCCRICKPCIMKMSCDIFCKKPCPKENVAMKSNSENQHNGDVLKWIPIISAANQTIEYSINQSSITPLIIPSLISSELSARQSASLPDEVALSKFEQAKTSNMTKPKDNPMKQQNTCKAAIHQAAGYCLVMAKVKNQTSEWRFDNATNVFKQLSAIIEAIAFQLLTTIALVQIWWNQTPKTSVTETRSDSWRIRYCILKAYICLMNTVLVESSQNRFVNVQCLRCNEICDPTVVKQSCQSYCESLCKFDYTKALTLSAYLWIILLMVTGFCVLTRYQMKSVYLKEDFGKSTQTYDNQPTDIVLEHYQTQLDPEKVTRTHNGEESHLIRAATPIPPQRVLSCNGQATDITQSMCYQELESVNHEVLLSTPMTETTEASEVNAPDSLNCPQASDRKVSVNSTENTFESTLVQTEYEDNGSIFTEMDSLDGRTISQESQSVDTNDIDVLNNRLVSTNNAISSILQLANNGTTQTIENIGNCLPLSSSALPIRSEDETYMSNDSTDNIDINRNTEFNCDQEKKLIKSLRIHVTQQLPVEASTQSREFPRVYNKLSEHNNADRKGENEDDCHALRQVTWLSGEDLPIPSLDYTVAIVHSEAQKILERLAKGEHIGAHESMKYEILRVCTYRNYPGDGKPFRIQLASAGWYFASDSDEVVCYCCGLRKSGWKEIDNPMKIHELLRPTCDYLVKRSEVNIPIPELPAERAAKFNIFESNTSDSTIQSRQGERASNFDSDSSNPQDRFYTPPPKHPQYAEISTRLETFKKWPTNIPQTAQIMADCGYYYAGFGDCVRCFHCGIGLRHWTEDDYPWVEHARWSKNCAYLRLKKGIEFIHNVHLAIDNDEEPEDLVPETPSGRPADMSQAIPNEDSSQILLTDPAQSVLTMGYQPRIIKRAIDIILQKDGKPGITAQKIMETIFMLEERDATATSNLQEELAKINISSASGGPDMLLKEAPNTSGGNAATGQVHGRARTQGNDKAKKDQQKNVKHSSEEKRNDKEESNKAPQKHNEATAHSEEGGGSESKSKVKDTGKIKAENRKLKEQTVCKICLDKPVSIVFLPCGHLVTCAECAPAMRKCPICRALVKGRVKAFMS